MRGLKIGKIAVKWITLIITIVMAMLLVASAWGGAVSPSSSNWLPVLTLAFPIFLLINSALLLLWLVTLQWRHVLVIVVAIVLSWTTVRVICPLNFFASNEVASDSTLRVMTFNVCNFGPYDPNNHTPSASIRYILDEDADIVLLQEGSEEREYLQLSNVEMMREELEKKYPYHSDGWRDLMILSKYPYKVVPDTLLKNVVAYGDGKNSSYHFYAKAFDLDMGNGKQLRLIDLHLQSIGLSGTDRDLYVKITGNEVEHSKSELRNIKHSLLDKLNAAFCRRATEANMVRSLLDKSPDNVILCGDFNDTAGSYCYRTIKGDDMNDAFAQCGLGIKHTYNQDRLYFKIDHILYRGELEAVDWKRDKAGDSDHYPQVATFVWK